MDLPNILHACRGQEDALFELDGLLKKSLIPDYRGLSVRFCLGLFSKTVLGMFAIFCMIIEDNRCIVSNGWFSKK